MIGNAVARGPDGVVAGTPVERSAQSSAVSARYGEARRNGIARRAVGVGLGVVLVAAAACADTVAPSEAVVQDVARHDHQALAGGTPPGQLRTIRVLDDCLPTDPLWGDTGGCVLPGGLVGFLDFVAAAPQGHPAWRYDPAYAKVELRGAAFKSIRVDNEGGRAHTFTPVAAYGGGIVPPLNAPGQPSVPECEDEATFGATFLAPGGSLTIPAPTVGTHRYMCCFHPWMRTELRVR